MNEDEFKFGWRANRNFFAQITRKKMNASRTDRNFARGLTFFSFSRYNRRLINLNDSQSQMLQC